MLRAYKYRIYPNEEQKVLMAKTFGCVRFVYNWALETKKKAWEEEKKNLSCYELQNLMVATLKKENEWLYEVSSHALCFSIKNMEAAYQNFFKHGARFPNFKRKHDRQAFHSDQQHTANFKEGVLHIAKIRNIKAVFHRTFNGTIKDVTISKEKDGRYYASILVDTAAQPLPKKPIERETAIGIDTGLKTFAVCSNGEEFTTPHFQKKQKRKLKLLSRKLSKKEKGSRAFNRTKQRIARVHSKIARQRLDYQHKITHRLTHENQVGTICVEDLNVRGMVRNKHLAYDISDAAIGEFYRQLKYKCEWYGVNYVEVGRFEPTSKTCSVCGWKYKDLKLQQRSWVCPECGTHHDRDMNAAINIREFGLKALRMGRAEVKPVECPLVDDRPSGPKKQRHREAGKVWKKRSSDANKPLV